ncbi:uncharacterized protein N7487_011494 [Penicillium crustosum]|uniref:uncharacterized protein n=1 Tax=Penicillium crustosum TaxID=36656 RepID=UPI002388E6B9|nr:uncharacterized protein N7487_011494 [Penicillium crustosum]KAJ5393853.1 hypothetical protein N7487_011494 [Penicillium crustosum]
MAAKELVNDMKLSAKVTAEGTYHDTFEPVFSRGTGGRWSQRKELWKKERPLGHGTYGDVWLERYTASETKTKFRAVKTIRKLKDTSHSDYLTQELEALAKFS